MIQASLLVGMPKQSDCVCFLGIRIRLRMNQFYHRYEALKQRHEARLQQISGCRKHVLLQIFRLHVLIMGIVQMKLFFRF